MVVSLCVGGANVFMTHTNHLMRDCSERRAFLLTLKQNKIMGILKITDKEREGLKYKSTIIRALQSSAVDNEKEQILDKLNINSNTFDTIRALTILGFEEADIVGLLTQPIIKEFVENLKDANSSLSEFVRDAENVVREKLIAKYDPKGDSSKKKAKSLSGKELIENVKSVGIKETINNTLKEIAPEGRSTDFNIDQIHLLDKFLSLRQIGKDIKVLQSTINTSSSFTM